jgi:hypothetical protein
LDGGRCHRREAEIKFYVGLHQPSDAKHFDRAFVSVNRLKTRKKPVAAREWIMDSGAFTEISTHGHYRASVAEYARQINRWAYEGSGLVAAVAQDWMCEPFIVKKTGLSVEEHQRLTIERYDALVPLVPSVYVMPVLQGYTAGDYLRHLEMYGDRLERGAYVGVGSVCKRNTNIMTIERILSAIKHVRPDLRLHGFGLKLTALSSTAVRECLDSADSMAWSFSARKQGRNANDWREAMRFAQLIARPASLAVQLAWEF